MLVFYTASPREPISLADQIGLSLSTGNIAVGSDKLDTSFIWDN